MATKVLIQIVIVLIIVTILFITISNVAQIKDKIHIYISQWDYFSNKSVIISTLEPDRPFFATPKRGENNIFFIESSCVFSVPSEYFHRFKLNERQACSVESGVKVNPNATIYLLYTCPMSEDILEAADQYIHALFSYPNFYIFPVNATAYFLESPLREWFETGALKKSSFPVEHGSDVLRLLTVAKYRGIYMDLDFIMMKSYSSLPANFVGFEGGVLANGLFGFDMSDIGTKVMNLSIEQIRTNYNGQHWSFNGPYLLTRVMQKICNKTNIHEATFEDCQHVALLPVPYFYSIGYTSNLFFIENECDKTMEKLKGNYGAHLWNKLSWMNAINLELRSPFVLLAKQFCPKALSVFPNTI